MNGGRQRIKIDPAYVDNLTRHINDLMRKVIATPERNFVKLLHVAELDPARDLRFQNWSGVDMSGCDLEGCDFTGARLAGCKFVGAKIGGARFDQAEVERAQLRQAVDWVEHERRWRRGALPGGADQLPGLAVFSDAPFAPELIALPEGEYWVGSSDTDDSGYDDERPCHRVTIGHRFALGRYPVTFAEYDRFSEAKRRRKPGDQRWGRGRWPVVNVSWQDAKAYIAWLSQETGGAYRLPSEAEWEYACRAGTTSRYSFGEAITPRDANHGDSGLGRTSEVGVYPANRWGLYDMHGNVWEWVEDEWHAGYRGAPPDGSAWRDATPRQGVGLCVLRGGSWRSGPRDCRSAFRYRDGADGRGAYVGFRVARTLSEF